MEENPHEFPAEVKISSNQRLQLHLTGSKQHVLGAGDIHAREILTCGLLPVANRQASAFK